MKQLAIMIMSFTLLSCFSFASEGNLSQQDRHIYFSADKVKITEKGISIDIGGQTLFISGVFSDEKGIFITESQLQKISGYSSKEIHRCYCRNPDCPSPIFLARHWRKYCSEACEYEHLHRGRW